MKRILPLLLALCLLCFAGCSEEASEPQPSTTEPAVSGGTRYTLVGIQLTDGGYMDKTALTQQSGGEVLYAIFYEDGTASLKIQKGAPVAMVYDATHIWRVETPELKASYQIDGAYLTILDYPFVYHFEK